MRLWIFDVEHGSCACLITDGGEVVLLDCGTNATTGFTPSRWLRDHGYSHVDQLVISHFDADHVADAHNLTASLHVRSIRRNRGRSAPQIRTDKETSGALPAGLSAALHLHESYSHPVSRPLSVTISSYWNSPSLFSDQNNLSLVAVLKIGGMTTIFPGDLEAAGWTELLKRADFRDDLNAVNFFVASHHGRRSGFTPEIFAGGRPKPHLCLVSDKSVHEEDPPDYGRYASGIRFPNAGIRRVLTTRSDGNILIELLNGQTTVRYGVALLPAPF